MGADGEEESEDGAGDAKGPAGGVCGSTAGLKARLHGGLDGGLPALGSGPYGDNPNAVRTAGGVKGRSSLTGRGRRSAGGVLQIRAARRRRAPTDAADGVQLGDQPGVLGDEGLAATDVEDSGGLGVAPQADVVPAGGIEAGETGRW